MSAPPADVAAHEAATYAGVDVVDLARRFDVPRVAAYDAVSSTLDVAQVLADAGVPFGTVVLAESQQAGRGRAGRRWESAAGAGIWLTLIERPPDGAAAEVLAIRIGLAAARVLDRWADERVQLKWPNDLWAGGAKLGGILVESRWRGDQIAWAAIGVGINRRRPEGIPAAALRDGALPVEVLAELIPALRAAATARGHLQPSELGRFADRDLARGRRCREPLAGVVRGISAGGHLLVDTSAGVVSCAAGSLVLEDQ